MKLNQLLQNKVEGLERVETTPIDEMRGLMLDLTHAVYPHEDLYEDFCAIHQYIDCPPEDLFKYMSDIHSFGEWTYSLRDLKKSNIENVYVGKDKIGDNTDIYCKVVANEEALTVDYHCAWDQGDDLWMIYLYRIVPAELVLKKPGSVVFWQNCRHPYYDKNPYQNKAPEGRPWVGDFWDVFYAGHTIELNNLKYIAEYRHREQLGFDTITGA